MRGGWCRGETARIGDSHFSAIQKGRYRGWKMGGENRERQASVRRELLVSLLSLQLLLLMRIFPLFPDFITFTSFLYALSIIYTDFVFSSDMIRKETSLHTGILCIYRCRQILLIPGHALLQSVIPTTFPS